MRSTFLLACIVSIASLLPAAAQKRFRAGVDLVHFSVVVTDKQGTPITGLTAADFEIVEEGKKQTIDFFAAENPEQAPPLHVGFLVDFSGSMEEDIRDVRTAAIKFINAMDKAEDFTVVEFDDGVRARKYAPSDYASAVESIRRRKPDGMTALYDALAVYLTTAGEQTGDKVLVMYTDGGDTRSATTSSEIYDMIRASDVTVYAVGYLEHNSGTLRMAAQSELQRFATTTGGLALFPTSMKDIDKMYARIVQEIGARYSLGYKSTDPRQNGEWRDVKIRLLRPDLKSAKLRTRAGYFAPLAEGR
jgi:Ca-activated chloride channel family protein